MPWPHRRPAQPPPCGRREAHRDRTRAEILAAAWVLVRSQGLAGLSMRDLGEAVGMRAQSVYSVLPVEGRDLRRHVPPGLRGVPRLDRPLTDGRRAAAARPPAAHRPTASSSSARPTRCATSCCSSARSPASSRRRRATPSRSTALDRAGRRVRRHRHHRSRGRRPRDRRVHRPHQPADRQRSRAATAGSGSSTAPSPCCSPTSHRTCSTTPHPTTEERHDRHPGGHHGRHRHGAPHPRPGNGAVRHRAPAQPRPHARARRRRLVRRRPSARTGTCAGMYLHVLGAVRERRVHRAS